MSEPPAKRARLEGEAHASGHDLEPRSIDAPGSPVDDFDDDFYGPSHTSNVADATADAMLSSSSALPAAPASAASSLIPGLGFFSESSAQQSQPQSQSQSQSQPQPHADPSSLPNEDVEDGELSDSEAFYGDKGEEKTPTASAATDATKGASLRGKPLQPSRHSLFLRPVEGNDSSAAAAPPLSNGSVPSSVPRGSPSAKTNATASDLTCNTQGDEGRSEFLQAAEANKDSEQAEWQLDSEASDSDSDSSSSDSSDDSSEDGELLSPEEAIKRMLAEDPEEDAPAQKAKVKTQNELDEQYTKPDITVTEDMKVTPLGKVENIVDNLILIKATTTGDYYVLESGSAVCLENRTVIGQISETIGRVQDPRYSIGFADAAEITTLGLTPGTAVYYVNDHSKYVFTEPLRAEKHTDASGQYDEETNQQEFSDDEEEAMHKRQIKEKKMERKRKAADLDDAQPAQPSGYAELPYAGEVKTSQGSTGPSTYQSAPLKYDDDDDDEDLGMYKPLARPDRFEDLVGAGAPIEDRSHTRRGNMRGRGGWVDRGRGFRGRGAMGGGGRGGADRGGMHNGGGRGDRFDRGGMNNNGGRGDRGGYNSRGRGDRGGNNNRGDRGNRSHRGQDDRHGRFQEQDRQRSGPPQDNRPGPRGAFSPAPAQQNQGRHQNPQHSPPRGKGKNRKRNRRETPDRSSQPPAAANTHAYASNNTHSGADWNSYSATPTPASYAPTPSAAPAPTAYANPAYYPQQPQQAQGQSATQAQMNMAQWIQLAAAISHAQQAQGQQQAVQHPPQPPQQPQSQHPYPYQQYQQAPAPALAPNSNPPQANTQQAGNPTLQDILRVLGQGSGT
ncbi:NAF1-domain-containing protein [Massarina eburnea CBS 473.64]|uniref:H/ACA ribonucleoprotein complex non-core subunit NAF1 n=1 Tax=Massarina eburnea CBS 473.64 TaxID=1395130 RepID=A0A6A6RXL5_9PLEO|nr:NAF1-domain-containing protein [Massarina eburnea CBS 473.64]